jgi:hypothetical protein
MKWTLATLLVACWGTSERGSGYELNLRGAIPVTAEGSVESGTAGTAVEPYYTITLGGADGSAAVVFTRAGPDPPPAGTYRVGEGEMSWAGFSGLIITGMPSHPSGVFHAQSGTITITATPPEHLAGKFELRGVGFLTGSPAEDQREILADGHFAGQ